MRSDTNSGTRRRIDIFQKSKMIRIENPKLLAWFQTPRTVSRPSRPNFQPHRTVEHTSQKLVSPQPPFTLKPRPKGAKKISAWFQTPQTVSRLSRPNFQPHRTVEHTSQKSVSLQPPFTLKLRPKGAKTTAGLVPATSDRFQTVQTQLGFQPEL